MFNTEPVVEFDPAMLEDLKRRTRQSPRGRFRVCLHRSTEDLVHEMLIACTRDTYFRPHRHPADKIESNHVIEGAMTIYIFDDDGNIARRIPMGPLGSGKTFIYRLEGSLWHLTLPDSDLVVFHEVRTGPFRKDEDVIYASWSPDESDSAAAAEYVARLRSGAR